MNIAVEQTHHHPLRGEAVHSPDRVELRADDYVVIDGVALDMRGAVGPFYIQDGDGFGSWSFERGEDGNTHLHIQHILAASEPLPVYVRPLVTETFPAYVIWPAGETTRKQFAFRETVGSVTTRHVKAANIKRWMKQLEDASDNWTAGNQSYQWARDISNNPFVALTGDAKRRYTHFNAHKRLLGLGRRIVGKYESEGYTSKHVPHDLTTSAQIESFMVRLVEEFRPDRRWFSWFIRKNLTAADSEVGRRLTGFTYEAGLTETVVHTAPNADDYENLSKEFDKLRQNIVS